MSPLAETPVLHLPLDSTRHRQVRGSLPVTEAAPRVGLYALAFAAAAALALLLALGLPLGTTVIGLIVFGLLHNFFELRYVLGRFGALLERPRLEVLLVAITGIAAIRLSPLGEWGPRLEIVVSYGLLAVALVWGLRRRLGPLVACLGAVAAAAALSLGQTTYHFVVLTHLHNIVPLFFLWEWARGVRRGVARAAFRAVQLGWVVVIPALILLGAFNDLMPTNLTLGTDIVGSAATVAGQYTPPAWRDGTLPVRFLTAFAFLQTMHYVVWCCFIPRVGRPEAARFEQALGGAGLVRGGRLTLLVGVGACALAAVLWTDYQLGRTVYGALASYHAYLEYPVLLLFILGISRADSTPR